MASALGRPLVLIVEDEPLLRINGAEMIADAGYDVVEAGNALVENVVVGERQHEFVVGDTCG